MRRHRPARKSAKQLSRHTRAALLEALERRQLMTRVMAGQSFEFQDVNSPLGTAGDIVRVKVTGPAGAFVDLVGASVIPTSNPELDMTDGIPNNGQAASINDIPCRDGAGTENLGGVGGIHGVVPIDVA